MSLLVVLARAAQDAGDTLVDPEITFFLRLGSRFRGVAFTRDEPTRGDAESVSAASRSTYDEPPA